MLNVRKKTNKVSLEKCAQAIITYWGYGDIETQGKPLAKAVLGEVKKQTGVDYGD